MKDDERFKNFLLFKVWATDKEMDEIAPILLGAILAGGIIFAIFYFWTC